MKPPRAAFLLPDFYCSSIAVVFLAERLLKGLSFLIWMTH
jgi:hypothetical protein